MSPSPWVARLILIAALSGGLLLILQKDSVKTLLYTRACLEDKQDEKELRHCLEKQLVDSARRSGPQVAIDAMKDLVSNGTIDIPNCHGLLHKVGQASFESSGGVESAFSVHDGELCAAGYYHGVVELALTVGENTPENVCNNIGTQNGEYLDIIAVNCYHGLGHAVMAASSYDLPTALGTCDKINKPQWLHCINGIFMENMSPAHGETLWTKADDPFFPCNAIDPKYGSECYHYSVEPLLSSVANDYAAGFAHCMSLSGEASKYCAEGISNRIGYLTATAGFGVSRAAETCLVTTNPFPELCARHVANTLVYQQANLTDAREFCEEVTGQLKAECAIGAVEVATQFPGIPARDREDFCNRVAPFEVRDQCLLVARSG